MPAPDAVRGRRQLLWSILSGCLVLVLIGLTEMARTKTFSATDILIRPVVYAALGAFAFKGQAWAARLAGMWLAVLALVGAGNALPGWSSTHPLIAWLLVAMGLTWFVIGYRLMTSPHIRAFMTQQAISQRPRAPVA